MAPIVRLFYCRLERPFSSGEWSGLLQLLPQSFHKKAAAFHRWQDAHAFVAGKLLLQKALLAMGVLEPSLDKIRYTTHLRPYLEDGLDFNITHSGQLVVCAIGRDLRVGIDIEEIRPIDLADFKSQWTPGEWQSIITANDTHLRFYEYWTRKEAVIKADGRGLHLPLKSIDITKSESLVDGTVWHLQQVFLAEDHIAHLATNSPGTAIGITAVDLAASLR